MGKIEQIANLIRQPFTGYPNLRTNERRVLTLASHGKTNREIASATGMTEETVAYYFRSGLLKVGMKKKELPARLISEISAIVFD